MSILSALETTSRLVRPQRGTAFDAPTLSFSIRHFDPVRIHSQHIRITNPDHVDHVDCARIDARSVHFTSRYTLFHKLAITLAISEVNPLPAACMAERQNEHQKQHEGHGRRKIEKRPRDCHGWRYYVRYVYGVVTWQVDIIIDSRQCKAIISR